ncbi:hypothetical protein H4R33_002806 [Dimargaris cristalligena]|nr:hypothetical protein H4R33_002806 [Dimargaris cristalligena]
MALSLPSRRQVLKRLWHMSPNIVDDARHEKILSYLTSDIQQAPVLGEWLADEAPLDWCQECITGQKDERIWSVALRFVGQLVGAATRTEAPSVFPSLRERVPQLFQFFSEQLAGSVTSPRVRYACLQALADMIIDPAALQWFCAWHASIPAMMFGFRHSSFYTVQATCRLAQRILSQMEKISASNSMDNIEGPSTTTRWIQWRANLGATIQRELDERTTSPFAIKRFRNEPPAYVFELIWTLAATRDYVCLAFIQTAGLLRATTVQGWLQLPQRMHRSQLMAILTSLLDIPEDEPGLIPLLQSGPDSGSSDPQPHSHYLWDTLVTKTLAGELPPLPAFQTALEAAKLCLQWSRTQSDPANRLWVQSQLSDLLLTVEQGFTAWVAAGTAGNPTTASNSGLDPLAKALLSQLQDSKQSRGAKRSVFTAWVSTTAAIITEHTRAPGETQEEAFPGLASRFANLLQVAQSELVHPERQVTIQLLDLADSIVQQTARDTTIDDGAPRCTLYPSIEAFLLRLLDSATPGCCGLVAQRAFALGAAILARRHPSVVATSPHQSTGTLERCLMESVHIRFADERWEMKDACATLIRRLVEEPILLITPPPGSKVESGKQMTSSCSLAYLIPQYDLVSPLLAMTGDAEPYARMSALDTLTYLIHPASSAFEQDLNSAAPTTVNRSSSNSSSSNTIAPLLMQRLADTWDHATWFTLLTDSEAFVRRATVDLIQTLIEKYPAITPFIVLQPVVRCLTPSMLRSLIDDSDYEVRVRACQLVYLLWFVISVGPIEETITQYTRFTSDASSLPLAANDCPSERLFQSLVPRWPSPSDLAPCQHPTDTSSASGKSVSSPTSTLPYPPPGLHCPYCLRIDSLLIQATQDSSRFVRARAAHCLHRLQTILGTWLAGPPAATEPPPPTSEPTPPTQGLHGCSFAKERDTPSSSDKNAEEHTAADDDDDDAAANGNTREAQHAMEVCTWCQTGEALRNCHQRFYRKIQDMDFDRLWATTSCEHLYHEAIESDFRFDKGDGPDGRVPGGDAVEIKMDMVETEAENCGNNILDCY